MNRNILLGLFVATAALMTACSTKTCKVDGNVTPGSAEDFAANVPNTVYFNFDKSDLTEAAKKRVSAQACWLKQYSGTKVTVEGHTDIRGTAEYNMALGEARANSTAKEIESQGVEASRVTTVSFGKERVIATGTTEADHAKNRRATTVVGN